MAGCLATGTSEWLALLREAWQEACVAVKVDIAPPPEDWLQLHHLPLLAALIPKSTLDHTNVSAQTAARFLPRLHLVLAMQTAERLRRRYELIAEAEAASRTADSDDRDGATTGLPALRPCALPPERQLSAAALRQLERDRRACTPGFGGSASCKPGPSGRPRQRWLRARLIEVLNTEVFPQSVGASSMQLLELFEHVVGKPYSDTPGACLASWLRALSTVLTNLLKGGLLASPLPRTPSRVAARWNRYPRVPADAEAWRRRVEAEETHQLLIVRTSALMAEMDAALARWVRMHRYLQPVELADGESSMELLLLWEVDHQRDFHLVTQTRPHQLGMVAAHTGACRGREVATKALRIRAINRNPQ
jgi:hypothetical protein